MVSYNIDPSRGGSILDEINLRGGGLGLTLIHTKPAPLASLHYMLIILNLIPFICEYAICMDISLDEQIPHAHTPVAWVLIIFTTNLLLI